MSLRTNLANGMHKGHYRVIFYGCAALFVFWALASSAGSDHPAANRSTSSGIRARLHLAFMVAQERLRTLNATAELLDALIKRPVPKPLSAVERTTLLHFDAWLENVARELHDHHDRWNTEYEHFIETDRMRSDLVKIFLRINREYLRQYHALQIRFLHELPQFAFTQPELRQRSEKVRQALMALR